MRSVRFDPALDERVRQAAAREGVSVSEFIRAAATSRADDVLGGQSVLDAWSDYIGSVDAGAEIDIARRHHEVFGEIVAEKHAGARSRRAG